MKRPLSFLYALLTVACLLTWISPRLQVLHAEENIPLAELLKPSESASPEGEGGVQWGMIFFNTLLVGGLGIFVLRQAWFLAWARRVQALHLDASVSLPRAMWQSVRLPDGLTAFPWMRGQQAGSTLAVAPALNRIPPEAVRESTWLQTLDSQVLATGTRLHWLRIHGEDYILTESSTHSQWLKIGHDTQVNESMPILEERLSSELKRDVEHLVRSRI